jgi:tRNA-2-methylthio-N6-dimethylallyladenosine synthase
MAHKAKTYYIKTFGCQMNEADSERLAGVLEHQGYRLAKNINQADVVVINTCSVRESAENRVFGLVQNLTRGQKLRTKDQRLILTGCMVGSARGDRQRYSLVELKRRLPNVNEFKTLEELIGQSKTTPVRKDKIHALVPIMEGCNHFCTYCVVPYARGKEISRPFEEIICEVEELARRGYKQITLLGQNVNSYGKDFFPSYKKRIVSIYDFLSFREKQAPLISIYDIQVPFALLLKKLHEIKKIRKISFLTSNPWDFSDELIEALALPKIDKTIHLPVQSGDNKILRRMNRGYNAKQYLGLIKKIKQRIPEVRFTTDIIVGFPGETKKAFENTIKLCKKVGFEKAYISKYSPRPGTAASKLKDEVSPEEKKKRWRILEELVNKKI